MADEAPKPVKPAKPLAEHEQRRKAALRANLLRRKEQARGRDDAVAPPRKTLIGGDDPA